MNAEFWAGIAIGLLSGMFITDVLRDLGERRKLRAELKEREDRLLQAHLEQIELLERATKVIERAKRYKDN